MKGGPVDQLSWTAFKVFFESGPNSQHNIPVVPPIGACETSFQGCLELTMEALDSTIRLWVLGGSAVALDPKKEHERCPQV